MWHRFPYSSRRDAGVTACASQTRCNKRIFTFSPLCCTAWAAIREAPRFHRHCSRLLNMGSISVAASPCAPSSTRVAGLPLQCAMGTMWHYDELVLPPAPIYLRRPSYSASLQLASMRANITDIRWAYVSTPEYTRAVRHVN